LSGGMAHGARAAHPRRQRARRRRRPGSARCGPRSCARRPARGHRPAGAPARARTMLPVTARASRWAAEQPPASPSTGQASATMGRLLCHQHLSSTEGTCQISHAVGPSRDQAAAADKRAHAGHSAHAAHCARRTTERRRPTCARTPSYLHSASAACERQNPCQASASFVSSVTSGRLRGVARAARPPRAHGRRASPAPPAASGRRRCPRRSWPASA